MHAPVCISETGMLWCSIQSEAVLLIQAAGWYQVWRLVCGEADK